MKKVFEIKVVCVREDGRPCGTKVLRRVYTTMEDAAMLVEAEKARREGLPCWWMDCEKGGDGRPAVWAHVLNVEGL